MAWRKETIAEWRVSRVLEVSEFFPTVWERPHPAAWVTLSSPGRRKWPRWRQKGFRGPCLEHEGRADLEFFLNLLVWSCSSSRLVDWAEGRGAERAVFIWQYSKFLKSMMTLKERRAEIKTLKWQLRHLLGVGCHQMIEWLWASSDKEQKEDFLGDPAIGNLPANAGDMVQSLAQEDSTCHRAPRPMRHDYWARMLQLWSLWAREPMLYSKRRHHNEKLEHGK